MDRPAKVTSVIPASDLGLWTRSTVPPPSAVRLAAPSVAPSTDIWATPAGKGP
jgi:hypothetical protein